LMGGAYLRSRIKQAGKWDQETIVSFFLCQYCSGEYLLDRLEKFGCDKRIASFVLPMGYSFNLDGSMMYCTFAVMFIAQAYGIELSTAQQITMLLLLMVTSKGMAGVPRASLVVIAATLNQFHIPEAGILLLLGIDHFLDMGRSATNVLGNAIAASVVAKSEDSLGETAPLGEVDTAKA
ncbi:dicarboxylate/amino acid:cation symporter, partial [Aeromonas caviae]|uniref:dicarboxylate/amino acid:cation symporter n=1 Tax=Aeromonas caviae TaxID=648 RepID=UPI001FC811E4